MLSSVGDDAVPQLVVVILGNGEAVRCTSLAHATTKATASAHVAGPILAEGTPEGGGPMVTLEFDRQAGDWVPAS